MTCTPNNCGIGSGGLPLPGDPNNDSLIWAKPAFGGIDVYWKYPSLNPQAVAHTKLYRGTSDNFQFAQEWVTVSANYHFDKTTTATPQRYYYWIRHVSLNGTIGKEIGPASAVADPPIAAVIEQLTAAIDASHLAQSLKSEIGEIQLNKLALTKEILERAKSDDGLAAALSEIRAFTESSNAILQQEKLLQASVNQAMGQAVNTLQVSFNKNSAGVQTQLEALVKADEALAKRIDTAQSQLGKDVARVETSMNTSIKKVDDTLTEVTAQYMAKVQADGLIGGFGLYNDSKRIDAGFDVDRFWVGRAGVKRKPFIVDEGRVYMDSAVIRDASIAQAKIGPFNIGDPNVYMPDGTPVTTAQGLIRADAIDVGNLKVQEAATFTGNVRSTNYRPGRSGWAIMQDGYVEFNQATIRGNLEIASITVNGMGPLSGDAINVSALSGGVDAASRKINTFNTWFTSLDYSITRATSVYFDEVPTGAQIIIYLNRSHGGMILRPGDVQTIRVSSVGMGNETLYRDYSYTPLMRNARISVQHRVLVDGAEIYNYTQSASRSESFSHSNPLRLDENLGRETLRFKYPGHKKLSHIRVEITIRANAESLGTGRVGIASGHFTRVLPGDRGSIQLSRLG